MTDEEGRKIWKLEAQIKELQDQISEIRKEAYRKKEGQAVLDLYEEIKDAKYLLYWSKDYGITVFELNGCELIPDGEDRKKVQVKAVSELHISYKYTTRFKELAEGEDYWAKQIIKPTTTNYHGDILTCNKVLTEQEYLKFMAFARVHDARIKKLDNILKCPIESIDK